MNCFIRKYAVKWLFNISFEGGIIIKRFILDRDHLIRDIKEYTSEYANRIYCEECGVPIYYIKGVVAPSHFRVKPPYVHVEGCKAQRSNKKLNVKKIQANFDTAPILRLVERECSGLSEINNENENSNRDMSCTEVQRLNISLERRYLRSISAIGKYLEQNLNDLKNVVVIEGGEEKKLLNVIYNLERFMSNRIHLFDQEIIFFGLVNHVEKTTDGDNISIYCGPNGRYVRIFVPFEYADRIRKKVDAGNRIILKGIYESEWSGQIRLRKLNDLYVLKL